MSNVVVIGATGDVGQGICSVLLSNGHRVIGVSRNLKNLYDVKNRLSVHGSLDLMEGSVSDERDAKNLSQKLKEVYGKLDFVVTTVNLKMGKAPLVERKADDIIKHLYGNLIPQFIAAKVFIPVIESGGMYLSIGGGMVDFIVPGNGLSTIAQGGQRNMIRMIAREARGGAVMIRELLLYSHITGESNREVADPAWFTDEECGRHVLAVITMPELFPGPILGLKSREQVGKPESQKPAN